MPFYVHFRQTEARPCKCKCRKGRGEEDTPGFCRDGYCSCAKMGVVCGPRCSCHGCDCLQQHPGRLAPSTPQDRGLPMPAHARPRSTPTILAKDRRTVSAAKYKDLCRQLKQATQRCVRLAAQNEELRRRYAHGDDVDACPLPDECVVWGDCREDDISGAVDFDF